jgi:predicted Zn-dependent protease
MALTAYGPISTLLCYHRLNQADKAVSELRAALAIEPSNTRAEELLADIYVRKREYGLARTNLDHILSVDAELRTFRHSSRRVMMNDFVVQCVV